LTVDYWLPITKVNVTGSLVTATRTTDNHIERKPTPAVVSVVTRPDYDSGSYQLKMDADRWATHHAKIGLLADARLASIDASNKSGRPAAFRDILGFAGMGAGLGAAAGGPFGALIGGAGALAIAAALTAGTDKAGHTPDDYEKLDIIQAYADGPFKQQASLLADLRIAEAKGQLDFAAAAQDKPEDLQSLRRRLRLIRAELALSEALYQKWLDSKVTTTTDLYDEEIAIEHLPGLDDPSLRKSYDHSDSELQPFHRACKNLGIAVGFEYEPSRLAPWDAASQAACPGEPDQVHYRVLRPGVLRVYAVTKDDQGRDKYWVRSTQRILVAAPGNEKKVPLLDGKADRSLNVAFDATGALTSISTDVTGSAIGAASALGELPATLKDAFAAGTELGTPFSAKGRAEALQAQADEKKARQDLYGVDPDQQLKEDVARAELEARLKAADHLVHGGASTVVVVMGGASR
jgi:hypothetical protein